ncbi:uncharacterized protein LOC114348703 [Diabrotica virgifera virgifera]|uniref:Uncharacterized protein LOC114348703 n=1 Tax=Diabrotica virgifera virgifera TaxID=50390 RepID=A0A6P7HBG5_DIAVI|nr:uncharacterized protein LOC114348703 [Diabrotica virgifera virgifera]
MSIKAFIIFVGLSLAKSASAQYYDEIDFRMIVQIMNVETNILIGVDTALTNGTFDSLSANQLNNLYAKQGLKYYDWILVPDCNLTYSASPTPTYRIYLADETILVWDHSWGCSDTDSDMIAYQYGKTNKDQFLRYDPLLQTINVCDDKCVFVDSTTNKLIASRDCNNKNKRFQILFKEISPLYLPERDTHCFF